jgi:hypothetical protein
MPLYKVHLKINGFPYSIIKAAKNRVEAVREIRRVYPHVVIVYIYEVYA